MVLWRVGGYHHIKEFTVVVRPHVLFPDSSDWVDASGKPIQFSIVFKYGKTDDLPSNLAQYLLDAKLAQESRLIL